MDTKSLFNKLSGRNKILLGIAAIILICAALLIVYPDITNENTNNSNQTVIVGNTNTTNTNATVVNQEITDTNSSNQTNTGSTNSNQVVVVNQDNTNQTSTNTNQTATNTNQQVTIAEAKTIDDLAVQLTLKQTGYCEALAPADWSFVSNAEATGTDLFSPDQSQHAGWGISAVYTYMYPDVDSFLTTWLGYAFTGSFDTGNITLGSSQELYEGFIQRDFTTSTSRKGVAIYKTYNFADPTMYVVSMYMADTTNDLWSTNGAIPFSVAISIRCVSQLRPTTSSVDVSTSDPSDSSDNPEISLSDKWSEAILGYENVYSPTTGEHYEAPLTSQWDTGPEGSGYYRSLPGGGYEKLERGFGNY